MQRLVIGCLAFSAIALVFIFVSAGDRRNYFRGSTKAMNDAIVQPATVLAADRDGAVTQTGNGRVSGFLRDGKRVWKLDYSRFEAGPANPYGAGAIDATASCAGACPSALVELLGTNTAHGGADAKFAAALNTLGRGGDALLKVVSQGSGFVRATPGDAPRPQLIWLVGSDGKGTGVSNPSAVEVDADATRAVAGAARGASGTLTRLVRSGGRWKTSGEPFKQAGLKNACISADGDWVGSVGTRIHRFAFDAAAETAFGPTLASGTCTVDASGITVAYTTAAAPTLRATRWSGSGKELWSHDFGAQTLLSRAGSPLVVAQSANGTVTALEASTGKPVAVHRAEGRPYVGDDGSIVTADREGNPSWLLSGDQ